jgi:hypothetical protein
LCGKSEVKVFSEDPVADGRIIFNLMSRKRGWRVWVGFIWFQIWNSSVFCECSNESSCSIEDGEVLHLPEGLLIWKEYVLCS